MKIYDLDPVDRCGTLNTSNHQTLSFSLFLGFALLIFGVRLNLIEAYSSFVPIFDDWGLGATLKEYESGELTFKFVLKPHNGHYAIWREFIQIFLFDLNQSQWDTRLQMVVNAFIWTATGLFLMLVIARNVLPKYRNMAVFAVLLFWLCPTSLENAIWGVQTHSYFMLLFVVLSLWFNAALPWTNAWCFGAFCTLAAPLSMGSGALVAPAILVVLLLRWVSCPSSLATIKPSLWLMTGLTIYSVWLTMHASTHGHNIYSAMSASSWFMTTVKSLSYPLQTYLWPSIVLLLPLMCVTWKVAKHKAWHSRFEVFVVNLLVYSVLLCAAIGYARGNGGVAPSPRYFEFLQLYVLGSFLALLLMQYASFRLPKWLNVSMIGMWLLVFLLGAVKQIGFFNETVRHIALDRPMQEQLIRDYLDKKDMSLFDTSSNAQFPYPTKKGLAKFIDKIASEDILAYELQRPKPLYREDVSTGFKLNTVGPGGAKPLSYFGEEVASSYHANGVFVSQLFTTNRKQLMIPVTGFLGYRGLRLDVVDIQTQERTAIIPGEFGPEPASKWQKVFVPAPENAFRLIAEDTNPDLWFGFGAPRTLGLVSVASNWLISHSRWIWLCGLLLLVTKRRSLII